MKKLLLLLIAVSCLASPAKAIYFDEDCIPQGYRGFADFSYTLGVGDWGKNHDRVSITTSHGYQIAPQFFAGVGVGCNYYYNDKQANLPIFAHFRSDILNNDITPYVDVKVGYALLDVKGFYLNPSVGCRFSLTESIGMNVGVGYTMQKTEYTNGSEHNCGGVEFRIGLDF